MLPRGDEETAFPINQLMLHVLHVIDVERERQRNHKGNPMTGHILIIDDEAPIRAMVKQMLEKESYMVEEADNGAAGLKLVANTPIDLVIVDIFMPNKDGLGVILEMQKNFPHVKIIAMSGGGRRGPDYLPIAQKLGAQHILAKPFERQELVRAVGGILQTEKAEQRL